MTKSVHVLGMVCLLTIVVIAQETRSAISSWLGNVVSGHFAPIEVVLTLVIGVASLAGLVIGLRWRTTLGWSKGLSVAAVFAVLQIAALRISFLPSIAKDR